MIGTSHRRGLFLVAALAFAAAGTAVAEARDLAALTAQVQTLAAKFPSFVLYPKPEKEGEISFLYADTKRVVHLYESDGGELGERWKSFPLEGTVKALFAEDLDRDGRPEIIAFTTAARVYVWSTAKFELLWESVDEKFQTISAMAVADVDRDPALELVIVADNKVTYYDGVEFFREKVGRDVVQPSQILIADVDGDQTNEIVTNDGYVLDTVTLNIEWATDGFGYPISLFDLDDDGIPEVVGESGGSLTFWSVADRREIW
jgi:hypothetical protein